jgi:hypothetical protein
MTKSGKDEQYSEEEADRRAREAIRRSFETPYRPQKELVGKTERARNRKLRRLPKTPPKEP